MSLAFDDLTLALAVVDWVTLDFLTPDFGACLGGSGYCLFEPLCIVRVMITVDLIEEIPMAST